MPKDDKIKCYASPAIAALFEACPDHEICGRCGCCDQTWESCQECCGDGFVDMDDEDLEWGDDDGCGTCDGQGGWAMCLGRCDKNGNHATQDTKSSEASYNNNDTAESSAQHEPNA